MKVVHVFKDYFPPTTGGIEQHMRLLCTRLATHHDVSVLVPSRSRRTVEEQIDGVRVIRAAEFGRYASAPFCPSAPWHLNELRPDLVHLHFPNPMGDLTYLLSSTRAPLVISYHADIIKQRRYLPLYQPVLQRLFRRAARIIAASAEYAGSSEFLRAYADRTAIIPYGIEPAALNLSNGDDVAVEKLRSESDKPIVLFVGALRYYKGLDVLIRAMQRVEARAIIAGRGSAEELVKLAQELGVANRVAFVGEVDASRLRVLFHAADVVVLPSIDRCEAFGIALLEGMACGKPIVSTDLPTGVRFVNRHEVTGLCVPPHDQEALAAALNRLLDDRELRTRLGQAGRRRVECEFDAARMVRQVLTVYSEVLNGRAVRTHE
jgi:rhamnosyl/mannosyltransferase